MRPFVIPLSLLLALALLGAGGQSVAKAAVAFQTPEPLETPLPTLAARTADVDQAADETARATMPATPRPYVLLTPEPLITPLPRPKVRPAHPTTGMRKPEPVSTPMVIALPGGQARNKGVTFTNGGVVYNLVFPLVGAPAPGQDFSVKLTNKPNSNQVEVSLSSKHGQAPAKHSQGMVGPADIQVEVSAPNTCAVEFSLDGQRVGEDRDPADGFAVALDTSCYTNGFHTLKAVARNDRGAVVQTVEHMVLFQN